MSRLFVKSCQQVIRASACVAIASVVLVGHQADAREDKNSQDAEIIEESVDKSDRATDLTKTVDDRGSGR